MENLTPGTRVKVRGIAGEATILPKYGVEPPGVIPVEFDAGDAGFVPESWVTAVEP